MRLIGFIAIFLGGAISFANWFSLYQTWRTNKFISSVPLIGAFLLGFGLWQFQTTRPYAWLSVVADYGTLIFIYSFPFLVRDFWSTSRINLIKEYVGKSDNARISLNLYKKGVFVIRLEFDPPQSANHYGAQIGSLGLQGKWEVSGDQIQLSEYAENRILYFREENGRFIATELNYPEGREFTYDLLDGIEFTIK